MTHKTHKKLRLTNSYLRRLIAEERVNLKKEGYLTEVLETGVTDPEKIEAEETDADEYAESLTKDVDFVKALKIEEARLTRRLNSLREMKSRAITKISQNLGK